MDRKLNALAAAKSLVVKMLIYIVLILIAVIVLYPLIWIVGSSINPSNSFTRDSIIPESATFANYGRLFAKADFVRGVCNTLYIAVLNMIFSVLINSMTSFVMARFCFKGRKAGMMFVTIIQFFPSVMAMTALYMIAFNFGMIDNLNMLVIIYVATGIPGNIWVARGFMFNLPMSLDEAAYIDGASKLQVFYKIILPLSKPIVSFIAFVAFMAPWMDYVLPTLLLRSPKNKTLALVLYEMSNYNNMQQYDFTAFCAGAVLIAVPIAAMYFLFQKYLITGIASGANKGE